MPKGILPDPKPLPTIEYLREALDYDPETGAFTWKARPREHFSSDSGYRKFSTRWANTPAGCEVPSGYISIRLCDTAYLAHRIAWIIHYGVEPPGYIDHINGVRTDNRICNLRTVDSTENRRNCSINRNNTSGITGVSWKKGVNKWEAYVMVNKVKIHLGRYANIVDAIAARDMANKEIGFSELHGQSNPNKAQNLLPGQLNRRNTSGYAGVYRDNRSGKWKANVGVDGAHVHLGTFDTLEQAAAARKQAEEEYGIVNRRGRGRKAIL